jgi:WD40 repeat protein
MKRSWTALAVVLAAVLVIGCNDYGNTFQFNTGAAITFLSPSQVSAGGAGFTLTVIGSGFVAKTVVQWNGKTIPTTVSTDSAGNVLSVTATVAAALLAKPGVATVNTLNPASGAGNNGLSNPIAFVINPPPNPIPVMTSISTTPANLTQCTTNCASPTFQISISGSNFLPLTDPSGGSQVKWSFGGTQTTMTPQTVSSSQIAVAASSSLLANAGTATVTVFNPPSPAPAGCVSNCNGGGGGGSSNSMSVTVAAAGPVTPKTAVAQSAVEETPAVSLDGRYVAYTALQDEHAQVFMRDTCEGAPAGCQPRTSLLSVSADGSAANDDSHAPSMSSDGRYVAFSSAASNLVESAPPGRQVFLRDTCAGAVESCKPSTLFISVDSNGALVGTESILPSVSSSGRFVAFLAVTPSQPANKFAAQTKTPASSSNSGYRQVFIRDTCLGAANCTPKTTRISLQPGDGTGSDSNTAGPALSGDSRRVAISSGNAATLFTRSMAVDDRVFLAITKEQH